MLMIRGSLKTRSAAMCVALILSLLPAAPSAAGAADEPFHIQAHRGAGSDRPENTLESFEYAWSLGVTPEADLRISRDGTIVCFHDKDLARAVSNADADTSTQGVEQLTDEQIAQLEVGSFRGEQYRGQRIPPLAEVFSAMQGRSERWLYLDIKTAPLDRLVELIKEHDVAAQVILATTHHRQIREWKQRVPDSMTLLWNGGSEEELTRKLDAVRREGFAGITHLQIHVRVGDLESDEPFTPSSRFLRQVGEELRQRGIVFQTLPWECADPRAYAKLLELGVESFATDYPEVSVAAVKNARGGEGR